MIGLRGLGLTYVIALAVLPFLLLVIWALMDALVRPDSQWAAADQNKTAWVIGLLAGPALLFPVGVMVSLVYLFGIRGRLARVARGYTPSPPVPPA
ncbi:MAG TPA: DUF2516 family protein [Acidimicrobiales bacterium]|nr:DUF2516 family protein [Acidimicrobiales bacterium]